MLNKLRQFNRCYRLIQPGDSIVCAVSGGADSMALLWALYLLREKWGITLSAAHFNHGLRGEESDRDEAFVREFCSEHEIALTVGTGRVACTGKGLEAAAREARYGFLRSLPGIIATAHTADDNAETLLLHLIRGTGLRGLGGIAPSDGKVIRPMLLVTRQQVLAFLQEHGVAHVEDSSNDTDAFLRNRIRHQVMPLLQMENPNLACTLSQTALRLRQDEQVLSEMGKAGDTVSVRQLRALPQAVQSRVLEALLKNCGVAEPEAVHIAQARALAESQRPSAYAMFPGNVCLRREYDVLTGRAVPPPLAQMEVQCPGVTELPGLCLTAAPANRLENAANTMYVRQVFGTLVLRRRQPGDCLRLPGGTKSLKKLMIDRKIPAAMRDRVPVLADAHGVLGVIGVGVNLDRVATELPAWSFSWEYR